MPVLGSMGLSIILERASLIRSAHTPFVGTPPVTIALLFATADRKMGFVVLHPSYELRQH
jgi:hypothetical protein